MRILFITLFLLKTILLTGQETKIDYSDDWKSKEKSNNKIEKAVTDLISQYDLSLIWETNNEFPRNGAIGSEYQRIQVFISSVIKDMNNPLRYLCKGKTKVRNNVCDFTGEIVIEEIYKYQKVISLDDTLKNAIGGSIVASYAFFEEKSQKHTGIFKGNVVSYWYMDTLINSLHYNELTTFSDSYENNTFVGTWKSYSSNNEKLCIWGDYRLPYTKGLYIGAGDILIGEKYINNGWNDFKTMWLERKNSKNKVNKWWK